jgi:hypothetical protein
MSTRRITSDKTAKIDRVDKYKRGLLRCCAPGRAFVSVKLNVQRQFIISAELGQMYTARSDAWGSAPRFVLCEKNVHEFENVSDFSGVQVIAGPACD